MNNKIVQEKTTIREEALRCLYCVDAPCREGCPADINIAQFIRHLKCDDLKSAKRVIKESNPLGGICAYLCPSQELCQAKCTRGNVDEPVHIRELQKYICDNADFVPGAATPNGKKVAVVGAGPAGLACAAKLAEQGVQVDVYEREKQLGGVVGAEIPAYRIADEAAKKDYDELDKNLIKFHCGVQVDAAKLAELESAYDAVFLGIGLQKDRDPGLAGGDKVMTASRFLTAVKSGAMASVSGTVVVIGGGDSAVDAAEAAVKHGADRAILTYRRSRKEMPATDETLIDSMLEGVELLYNTSLTDVAEQGGRLSLSFVQNRLKEVPGESRRVFEAVPGSAYEQTADLVVFALGKTANQALTEGKGQLDEKTLRLGSGNVYAGGDFINGGQTVVEAVKLGKRAAEGICGALGL